MGEVNISQSDLQSFLKTAELLQIKGLTENVSWNPETDAEEGNATEHDEETRGARGDAGGAGGAGGGHARPPAKLQAAPG